MDIVAGIGVAEGHAAVGAYDAVSLTVTDCVEFAAIDGDVPTEVDGRFFCTVDIESATVKG